MPQAQFVTVSNNESGQKLLQFLERRLTGEVPRSAIQRWIRKGQVRVDKGRKKPFDRIEAGQIVRIPPYTPGESKQVSTGGDIRIVYEDETLMVVAKPSGLAAHGGDKIEDSVAARIAAKYANADFLPTLAHRLDRDTSGLLLVAKSYERLRQLNDQFAARSIGKLYLAWAKGRWAEQGEVTLEDHMEKDGVPEHEKVRTGSGKLALANVVCLRAEADRSLLAVRLLTGRTHQIRVQLASRRHPVIGDRKYGQRNGRGSMRLHCFAMHVGGKTYHLPPPWDGQWAVDEETLAKALPLVSNEPVVIP